MRESIADYHKQNDIRDAIIWEEALPFSCGEKPAEETAKAINSRVQLYLDEKKKQDKTL